MSKIAFKSSDTGSGKITFEAPVTNTNRTLTLPDTDGILITTPDGEITSSDFFTATVQGSNDDSDWTQVSSGEPWIAILTVNGIRESDRPTVSLDISGESLEDGVFLQRVWNLVYRVEASADDEIKLYAVDEPYPDLDLLIKVVR